MATPGQLPTGEPKSSSQLNFLLLRASGIFLALSIGAVQLFFLITIGLTVVFQGILTIGLMATIMALAALVNLIGTSWLVANWLSEFYEIRPDEVSHVYGLFGRQRHIFNCRDVREVKVTQSTLGRFLRYGTIELISPALEEPVRLAGIANPNRHLKVLTQLLPGLEEHSTIFIREHKITE
ncbi:PH domain-containing protein [Candidatus Berkelbacteria bacterium]|nr:PH domain-containing protein [Candidatus Berkelbacteria bacterium]